MVETMPNLDTKDHVVLIIIGLRETSFSVKYFWKKIFGYLYGNRISMHPTIHNTA